MGLVNFKEELSIVAEAPLCLISNKTEKNLADPKEYIWEDMFCLLSGVWGSDAMSCWFRIHLIIIIQVEAQTSAKY